MATPKPSRVFVTNNSGQDFSRAEPFGTIVNITRGFVRLDELPKLKVLVASKLRESSPDDFLILTGSPLICIYTALFWLRKHKQLRVLDYRRENYREVLITEDNLLQFLQLVESDTNENSPQND